MKSFVASLCLAALASMAVMAAPQLGLPYVLPMDADLLLDAPLDQSFTCEGQQYGYYADVNNNCQLFHVCLPIEDDVGNIIDYAQWSFVCGNQTIFDQQTLSCNYPEDAFPCAEAPSLYNTVAFGVIDDTGK